MAMFTKSYAVRQAKFADEIIAATIDTWIEEKKSVILNADPLEVEGTLDARKDLSALVALKERTQKSIDERAARKARNSE